MKVILLFVLPFFVIAELKSQANQAIHVKDTILVGKLLDVDPTEARANINHAGIIFYYGVYHLKIERIDIRNNSIIDTVLLAMVYNINTEMNAYRNKFGLKTGSVYAFHVDSFTPCKSDFPRIAGRCRLNDLTFFPVSNKLIKQYVDIPRIILFYVYPYDKNAK